VVLFVWNLDPLDKLYCCRVTLKLDREAIAIFLQFASYLEVKRRILAWWGIGRLFWEFSCPQDSLVWRLHRRLSSGFSSNW
jgi:hypothetical protein